MTSRTVGEAPAPLQAEVREVRAKTGNLPLPADAPNGQRAGGGEAKDEGSLPLRRPAVMAGADRDGMEGQLLQREIERQLRQAGREGEAGVHPQSMLHLGACRRVDCAAMAGRRFSRCVEIRQGLCQRRIMSDTNEISTGGVSTDATSEYRAYTTKFDVVATAADLNTHLGHLSPHDQLQLDAAWQCLQADSVTWRVRHHLLASEIDARIRSELSSAERSSTVVALLFDQSGSMRGQKMLFAAVAADVAREFLVTLGIRCEILGFTTVRWRGGKSRRRWKWRLRRPRQPGRLNDLLHIVYKDAEDTRASAGGLELQKMLRHDLPKENIDGEAVEWASERLLSRPEARKLLIVLSDGAPVDDSTLLENGPTYLADHLQRVVENLYAASSIELAALGIGYAAHHYYKTAAYVEAPADLGEALMGLLEQMLLRETEHLQSQSADTSHSVH